jgi:hypothetical protein
VLFPLLGGLLGLVFFVVKVAAIVGLVMFVFWLFRRKSDSDKAAPAD